MAEETVVDVDVHLRITNDQVAARLDEPHRGRLERTDPFLSQGWDRYMGKIQRRSAGVPDEIAHKVCDTLGVDRPILNPTLKLPRAPQTRLATALMPAYNDVMLERFLDADDRFAGLAVVTPRDPARSAEELDRLADEPGVVGALIASTGVSPPLGDPRYDVLYRAAEDNGLPVAFHAAAGGFIQDFPIQSRGLEQFMAAHPLAHLWCQMLHLTSLLVNGTPEKFPDLDFVFLEAGGVAWIPMMMYRLNKEYSIRRSEAPLLTKSPESSIRDSVYFSTQPFDEPDDESDLGPLLSLVGAENLMFSSDFPHWDFDDLSTVRASLERTFDAEDNRRVLAGNATEVFGL